MALRRGERFYREKTDETLLLLFRKRQIFSVEFIDNYESGGSRLFRVMLWQKNEWYNCLFEMRYEGIATRFDGVQQDRVW
ncbi:MAG: hypothetical protein PUF31_03770 [Oscillospiraceae bacterium]|nr:hypothetical protein [Oscillospiraceae bacterium]